VIRVLATRRIDVAELYPDSVIDMLLGVVIKVSRIPLVLNARGAEYDYVAGRMNTRRRTAFRITYWLGDFVIYKEPYMPSFLAQVGKRHVAMLPNAVNVPSLQRTHEGQSCAFLFLNTLKSFRHPELCLEAFLLLCDELGLNCNSPIRLFVVGLPNARNSNAEAQTKARALSDAIRGRSVPVELVEWTNEPSRWLSQADVLLLPADLVYLNYSLLEAMALGIPPIIQKAEAAEEIIAHGEEGFVLPRDARIWAEHMRLLLDPSLRGELGAAARRKVQSKFSVEAYWNRYCRIYEEVIRGRRTNRIGRLNVMPDRFSE